MLNRILKKTSIAITLLIDTIAVPGIMDPVSFVATVAQLIDAGSKVIKYLNDVKNAPKERAKLAREVSNLLPLFIDLRYRVEETNATDPWFAGLQSLGGKGGPLDAFKDAMEAIATKLESKSGGRRLAQILFWTLKQKEIDSLLLRIERLKTLIGLALQKDNSKLSRAIKDGMTTGFQDIKTVTVTLQNDNLKLSQAIKDDVTDMKNDQASQKLQQWLAAPEPSSNHNAAMKKRQPSTGEWFTGSKEFIQWKIASSSFLWLHGIPGCGKTILCSTIIQKVIETYMTKPAIAVVYFYFDFNDRSKQRSDSLVRSLLTQLLAQCPSLPGCLESAYSRSQDGQQQPTTETLTSLLHQVLQGFGHTYLFFDALDECVDRDELHSLIMEITQWNISTLHMLATSRREKDIEDALQPLVTCQICIQSAVVDTDIRVYILDRLSNDLKLKKWPTEAKREIEKALMVGANGMQVTQRFLNSFDHVVVDVLIYGH